MALVDTFNEELETLATAIYLPSEWLEGEARRLFELAGSRPNEALGGLAVLTAALVRKVKSADPADGLEPYHDQIARAAFEGDGDDA